MTVPRGETATDDTWMKFHAPGTPAAVCGGAGHSTSLYGSDGGSAGGADGAWADSVSAIPTTVTSVSAKIFCMRRILSAISCHLSALGSQFPVLSSQFSVLSSQLSVLSSQFSVLSSQRRPSAVGSALSFQPRADSR